MQIVGSGLETYLYLNGISTKEEIILDKNVSLLPAICNPTPDDIIKVSGSEIDLGITTIFLRHVDSQLKIVADNPKDLAIIAWNSLWDALLLSAIFNCEVGFNFQCNHPAELFSDKSEFKVTNYHMRGLVMDRYVISETGSDWLSNHFSNACELLKNKKFETAVHSMSTFRWHSLPRIQLAVLWSGIEALFNVESEISFRISLYISKFLTDDNKVKAKEIFDEVRILYRSRSTAVHGSKIKGDDNDQVKRSAKLLNDLIIRCITLNRLPQNDDLVF